MKNIKLIAGIAWAAAGLLIIIMLFPGLGMMSRKLATLPFMKINPNFSGGEVGRQLVSPVCTLDIRRPVFDGLFSERRKGFVQFDWRGKLPGEIEDSIDYDFDSIPDFYVLIDTKESTTYLKALNPAVKDINVSAATSYGWALRVNLIRDPSTIPPGEL
ncbi:MAG TPA: hypothetical protein PLX08_05910 [Bacteroidales bacterium]|jgi:hypothetical protein|nr:hypothetical protein [Bacteroidales bacterium]